MIYWNMQKEINKYFWDSDSRTFSGAFQLQRFLEYASFPDLFKIDFSLIKNNIARINLESNRIPHARRLLLKKILPYIAESESLDEAVRKYFERNIFQ